MALLAIIAPIGLAQDGLRLQGVLEESWRRDGLSDTGGGEPQSEFIQNYDLNMSGAILTPNFLSWQLGTGLRDQRMASPLSHYRSQRINVCNLRMELLKARPLSYQFYGRQDLLDQRTHRRSSPRSSDLTLEAGVRLANPGWPLTRLGYQVRRVNQAGEVQSGHRVSTLEMRNNSPHSDVDLSVSDNIRFGRVKQHVQEIQLRGATRLWDESTAMSGETRLRLEARSRDVRGTVRMNGRWRERDRMGLLLTTDSQYLWTGSRHNLRAHGDYRRMLWPHWNAYSRGDLSSMRINGAGAFRSSRQDLASGLEYEQFEQDSLIRYWRRAKVLVNAQRSSEKVLRPGLSVDYSINRNRWTRPYLELGWGAASGIVFQHLESSQPYGWITTLRGEANLKPAGTFLGVQQLDLTNQTGSRLRQSIASVTNISWSPVAPIWLQSGVRATRELRPLRRNTLDWNSSMAWPLSPRLSWITEWTITYLGGGQPLSRRARSTLDLTQRRLHFFLEGRYERVLDRRNLGASVNLTRTIGSR